MNNTYLSFLNIKGTILRTVCGDITKIKNIDAIVNSSNTKLINSAGGVNERIHKMAGPGLLEECKKLNGCKIGEAKITSAYNLPCKYVIHTVGPKWEDGHAGEMQMLRECYINALSVAVSKYVHSIAFPSISTGLYSFPINIATDIAIRSVADFINEHSGIIREVVWVLNSNYTESNYQLALARWNKSYQKFGIRIFNKTHEHIIVHSKDTEAKKSILQKHYHIPTELHCVDDMHLLVKKEEKKVIIGGAHYPFPIYKCAFCGRNYTSISGFKDLSKINLASITYVNIIEDKDKLRLSNYLSNAHLPETGCKCNVYTYKPEKCPKCNKQLQTRKIKYITASQKEDFYIARYCQDCDEFYIHYTIYEMHSHDWILLNPVEYKNFVLNDAKKNSKENAAITKAKKLVPKSSVEHDNNIGVKDFVIKKNTFKCLHKNHKIQDIDGRISVITQKGNIQQFKISAGYCPQCNLFFILESTYEYLKKKGTPVCRISSEKAYLKGDGNYSGMKLAQESILMQHGYTVSQTEGLSPARRQKILAVLIDNKILTKNDIISYLDFFISQKKSNHMYEKAIAKWQNDREFVAEYKIGQHKKYNVKGISVKY